MRSKCRERLSEWSVGRRARARAHARLKAQNCSVCDNGFFPLKEPMLEFEPGSGHEPPKEDRSASYICVRARLRSRVPLVRASRHSLAPGVRGAAVPRGGASRCGTPWGMELRVFCCRRCEGTLLGALPLRVSWQLVQVFANGMGSA